MTEAALNLRDIKFSAGVMDANAAAPHTQDRDRNRSRGIASRLRGLAEAVGRTGGTIFGISPIRQ